MELALWIIVVILAARHIDVVIALSAIALIAGALWVGLLVIAAGLSYVVGLVF